MKKISELTKQELEELIMSSRSYSSIYRKLGYTKVNNHTTLKSYMKQYGIDMSLLGISIENKRREIIMNNIELKSAFNADINGTRTHICAETEIYYIVYIPKTDCELKSITIAFSNYSMNDIYDIIIGEENIKDNNESSLIDEYDPKLAIFPNGEIKLIGANDSECCRLPKEVKILNKFLVKNASVIDKTEQIELSKQIKANSPIVIQFHNSSFTEKDMFVKFNCHNRELNKTSDDTLFVIPTSVACEKQASKEPKLLSNKEIIDLGKKVVNLKSSEMDADNIITYEAIHELLREQFQIMCSNYYLFQAKYKYNIFHILAEIVDGVTPKKILPSLATWLEIKAARQGDKIDFKIRQKEEIKKYVSKASFAGDYSLYPLKNDIIDIPSNSYGGYCEISLELFINGYVDFNEIVEIISEELILSIKKEIHYALYTFGKIVTDNRITGYGNENWVSKILPLIEKIDQEEGVRILTGNKLIAGAILAEFNESPKKFQKHEVIILPPYNNNEKNINNRFVYVMPKGIDKMLLLGLEGSTIIMDRHKKDASIEFELYKKIGVACVGNPLEMGVFEDTSIS